MKFAYAESNGALYVTDGFGRPQRWDGTSPAMVDAGVAPPATAPTITFSGIGNIVGTYTAYVRFLDALANMSNLSPISAEVVVENAGGTITGASKATPIVITTSVPHGLTTGMIVKVEGVGGNTAANDTWTITVISSTTFSLDTSAGTVAYSGGGTYTTGVEKITYTNVPVPTDPKVITRQILRNTDGDASTYYVDVETNDLTTMTFDSTFDDNQLAAQEQVPLFDTSGEVLANSHDQPPQTKIAIVNHLERMYYFGEEDYTAGACKVATGSATVVGVDTDWNSSLEGRFLYVAGAGQAYEIASVTDDTHLELVDAWLEASDNLGTYAIRSSSYELKAVLFSEPGVPESVPPRNALLIRQNSDRIRGGYASGAYLYILENRHIHRAVVGADPLNDGGVYPGAERGVLNHRCFDLNEGTAYCLDEQGCHATDENGTESISAEIQDLFRAKSPSIWRINWRARAHFHSVFHNQQDTMRWFVALAGCSRPKHALAYNVRLKRWWIEEYPRPITSSCIGRIAGVPTIFLGTDGREVFAFGHGYQDFCDSRDVDTKRGTVTSATLTTLTDSTANFQPPVVGATVHIVDGTGRGQFRRIVSRTATTLTVLYPWLTLPDAMSVYQVGGVKWQWRTKDMRLENSSENVPTGFELVYQPVADPATLDLEVFDDVSPIAVAWKNAMSSSGGRGVRVDEGQPRMTVDLTEDERGVAMKRFDRHLFPGMKGARYRSVRLSGVTNADQITVYELVLNGMK